MSKQARDYALYHMHDALLGALADAEGNEAVARRASIRARIRLITMSGEELKELAQIISHYTNRPEDVVRQELSDRITKLKQTASEWLDSLPMNAASDQTREI